MRKLFTIMIMALSLLWGFSVPSNAGAPVVPLCAECGQSSHYNVCCPDGENCEAFIHDGDQNKALCVSDDRARAISGSGGCCLDGNSLPGTDCICNQPPDCSDAAADPNNLWPPNHKLVEVWIVGVTDPDGDPVDIRVNGISQDEPTEGTGQGAGNTCPDARGVGTSIAAVRAERSGNKNVPGDGRVYHIYFTAQDDQGATCQGHVSVCVPHDQSDTDCVDGGKLFDSTVCDSD